MNPTLFMPDPAAIVYPESDGQPMADNSKQLRWIFILYGNIAALFRQADDVFVGSNQFWYPLEGHPEIVVAPDVYAVFGRPKGDRPSYMQWLENDVPMTVVFEILSPKNTVLEMADKLAFYDEHGVSEYYVYDPDENTLQVYVRRGEAMRRVRPAEGFQSPRLGIRFDLSGPEMVVYGPDGQRFLTFEQLTDEREKELSLRQAAEHQADQARQQADQARQQADQARHQADQARHQADQARQQADQAQLQADQAQLQADQAQQNLDRIRELSRKARRGMASVEELAELDRLEEQSSS